MTRKQKQALLSYLGAYDGPLDGIWGDKSRQATIDFQRAYMDSVDGIFGEATEKRILEVVASGEKPRVQIAAASDWWQAVKYFSRWEFRCPCGRCGGFPVEPEERMVRQHFDAPATVSSGVRCQAHNDELPGSVKNSYHLRGKAMDFCVRGVSGATLLAYVRQLPGVHYAYQIDDSFVHMDVA